MSILGIVVEYNPFHNGHAYHLKQSRKTTNPELTVAVMSGNFVQRGEPAITEKFARTEMALKAGVDLVIQLPLIYSIQDAGGFARGSVWLLDYLGVTDMVFGSESGNLDLLNEVASVLVEEPEVYLTLLRKYLDEGFSFPNARKFAIRDYLTGNDDSPAMSIEEIGSSNNILGLEYIRSLKELKSKIKPHLIKRIGAHYHDEKHHETYSSATAIRNSIIKEDWKKVKSGVPDYSYGIIHRELENGKGPVSIESMESFLLPFLRTFNRDEMKKYYGFVEGLDARFEECASNSATINEFFSCVKAKRFTYTRIKRLLLNLVFHMKDELIRKSHDKGPQYIRVLGFNEKGREYLSEIKKELKIPLLATPSHWAKVLKTSEKSGEIDSDLFFQQFMLDIKETEIHSCFYKDKTLIRETSELKSRPLYMRS
ncbi:MAG: nucleotidyltransferase [Thermotogota bacterium]|nr:nucleotidyltransferase [Thermotogota bacterium]